MQQFFLPLLIVLVAIPLFLQARKQKKTMQEQQKLQNSIGAGDRVMTTSGLYGTVVATTDDTVDLEIAEGLTTTWLKQAIRERVEATDSEDESDEQEELQAAETESAEESTEGSAAEPAEKSAEKSAESATAESGSDESADSTEKVETGRTQKTS